VAKHSGFVTAIPVNPPNRSRSTGIPSHDPSESSVTIGRNHRSRCSGIPSKAQLKGKTIAVWGLAFKPNTDDMRAAPSRTLMEALWQAGAKVQAFDPVAMKEATRIYGANVNLTLCADKYAALQEADALVICTEWQQFRAPDFGEMEARMCSKVIVDGRNMYPPHKLLAEGWDYLSVGRSATSTGALRGLDASQTGELS
jgi:hypothetical protein